MRAVRGLMVAILAVGLSSLGWTWFGADAPVVRVPPLQIEVLNGCGESGLATKAAERLRALGHDVVGLEDAPEGPQARTVIVDRRGRDRITRELARRIGPCPLILEQLAGARADLTLILGPDWPRMRLFAGDRPT